MVIMLLLPMWAISVFLWSVFWGRRDTRLGQLRPVRCALTITAFYVGLVVTGATVLLSNELANGGFGIVSSISIVVTCLFVFGMTVVVSLISYAIGSDRAPSPTLNTDPQDLQQSSSDANSKHETGNPYQPPQV